jgi:hypothetical protein
MRKTVTAFLLLVTLIVPLAPAVAPPTELIATKTSFPDKDMHVQCLYPSIMIYGSSSAGTGTIIRSEKIPSGKYLNTFLTCAHVIDSNSKEAYKVCVYSYANWSTISGKAELPCIFIGHDDVKDVAVGAFLSDSQLYTAKIDFKTKLYVGTPVLAFGCGLTDIPRMEEGKVTSPGVLLQVPGGKQLRFRSNMNAISGDSGCAVYHNYKIIGTMHAIRSYKDRLNNDRTANFISFVTPVSLYKDWSDANKNTYDFIWDTSKPFPPLLDKQIEQINRLTPKVTK